MASLEIVEPTEKDKGKYTIEIVDVEKTYTRTLELSGKGRCRFFFSPCHGRLQILCMEDWAVKTRHTSFIH